MTLRDADLIAAAGTPIDAWVRRVRSRRPLDVEVRVVVFLQVFAVLVQSHLDPFQASLSQNCDGTSQVCDDFPQRDWNNSTKWAIVRLCAASTITYA